MVMKLLEERENLSSRTAIIELKFTYGQHILKDAMYMCMTNCIRLWCVYCLVNRNLNTVIPSEQFMRAITASIIQRYLQSTNNIECLSINKLQLPPMKMPLY